MVMSTKPPKIPKQLFVTLKKQDNRSWDGTQWVDGPAIYPLGFVGEYAPTTQAFTKRKATQMQWAYGYGYEEHADGIWVSEGREWIDGKYELKPCRRADDEYQPRLIVNEPIEGFSIQRSVSRYGTSNKVWRVLDPRGFEFEISSATFEDLVLQGMIIKGVIQGPCIYHTGKIIRYA